MKITSIGAYGMNGYTKQMTVEFDIDELYKIHNLSDVKREGIYKLFSTIFHIDLCKRNNLFEIIEE